MHRPKGRNRPHPPVISMAIKDQFIPGIHNYCDRWCERCDFGSRCEVFAIEAEYALEESDDPMGDAVRTVAAALADAKRMLIEKAEETGVDIVAEANSPEVAEIMKRQHDAVYSEDAFKLAHDYALSARHTLEAADDWVEDAEDPLTQDMLAILRQYLFSIPVKVHSSFHAALDFEGYDDPDQLIDPQSDTNGTVKTALIMIERSLLAWAYLSTPSNSSIIRPWLGRLEQVRSLLETKFPKAHEFIRPGFDEIDTIM